MREPRVDSDAYRKWAVVAAACYTVLLLSAFFCPADLTPSSGRSHGHQHHHAGHTHFCVWACQLASPATLRTIDASLPSSLILLGVVSPSISFLCSPLRTILHPRGPPPAAAL